MQFRDETEKKMMKQAEEVAEGDKDRMPTIAVIRNYFRDTWKVRRMRVRTSSAH